MYIPAATRRNNNVFITSKRRRRRRFDVMKTLLLRHYCVMCPVEYLIKVGNNYLLLTGVISHALNVTHVCNIKPGPELRLQRSRALFAVATKAFDSRQCILGQV